MKTWIASDLHFSHKNALRYFPARHQFANIQQMNSEIISRWNSVVQPGDSVYLLGDVAFCDANTAVELLEQLNGNKILVAGNHDTRLLQSPKFHSVFESVHQYLTVHHAGCQVVMFHFPLHEWDRMYHGSIHLHGHTHGIPTGVTGRIFDVSIDGNGCCPYDMDELVSLLQLVEQRKPHAVKR